MPVNWRSRRVASCERLFIRRLRHSARRLPRDARIRVAVAGEAAADQRVKELTNKRDAQRKEQESAKENRSVIKPRTIPGLKVHVCTLVAPDSPGRSGSTASTKDRALTREERIEATQQKIAEQNKAIANGNSEISTMRMMRDQENMRPMMAQADTGLKSRLATAEAKIEAHKKERDDLHKELKALEDAGNPIDWVDVYIHAKLMIIDDTFMTVGSANINSRSMETDSELNIIHANYLISHPARKALWEMHTKSRSGGEVMGKDGMYDAYINWKKLINKNKTRRFQEKSPVASLVEFFSGTESRSDLD